MGIQNINKDNNWIMNNSSPEKNSTFLINTQKKEICEIRV